MPELIQGSNQIKTLPVVGTFKSIFGDGAWAGASAFFVRLAGCPVRCHYCDSKDAWSSDRPLVSVETLVQQASESNAAFILITGGEPLMHDLSELTYELKNAGHQVHLETSGVCPLKGVFDWITLSPKPTHPPLDDIYRHVAEMRVVVSDAADLFWAEEQARLVQPPTLKYLQPEYYDGESTTELVLDYVKNHPQWRVGFQNMKLLGLR